MNGFNSLLVGIELTGHCNLRCKHCLREDRSQPREIDSGLFESIVTQASSLGRVFFAFSGGEPTLHSEFRSLIEIVQDVGQQCRIVTNGCNFPAHYKFLCEKKETVREISISLDGPDEATHDFQRGKGAFADATMAISLAAKGGWPVTVQCVVTSHNFSRLPAVAEICADLGVSVLLFSYLLPVPRAARAGLSLSMEQWTEVEKCVSELAATGPLPIGFSTGCRNPIAFAHCNTMRHLAYSINCDGFFTYCCQLSGAKGDGKKKDFIADLRETSLVDAISMHMEMTGAVLKDRLQYYENHPLDPMRDFHCNYCLGYFGKQVGHALREW